MLAKKFALGATTALISTLAAGAAFAQSTGSTTVNEVVVTGKQNITISGVINKEEAPKTREVVTQDYIATQPPGQNVIQDLNLVPGLNYTNEDPFGMAGSGGHLRIRGLDGSRISLMMDGTPLNDTGNYAIYPGELVDQEVIAQANVNVGSTDVDSPTASAVGGTININSITPSKTFGGFFEPSVGDSSYGRVAMLLNTGEFGPFGTTAFFEGSYTRYSKFKGPGDDIKKQFNGKIYQDLHHNGDFIAIAGFWDDQLIHNLYGLDLPRHDGTGKIVSAGDPWGTDYQPTYTSAGKTPGTAGNDGGNCSDPASGPNGGCYYGNQVNPTATGNIRGQSRFTLLPNLKLTVDPSFQYVLADGGGQAKSITENNLLLTGLGLATSKSNVPACYTNGVVSGLDLNRDGDCLDTVRTFQPSVTQTHRITLNTSLIWDINPDNLLRFSYAYDHGHHRQTGEFGFLGASGVPGSVYGGKGGWGSTPILAADGTVLEARNRLSIAELNQFSLEYVGKFFDDHLRVDLGVRDPHFSRDLNQYCYTSKSSGSSVLCTQDSAAATKAGYTIAPFAKDVSYTKVLPNVGLTWRFDPANMVYFSYSQELSAPRTDDLYTVSISGANTVNVDNVKPETSTNYELGYRYQTARILGTLDVYKSSFQNRIVSTYDQDTGLYDDRNVGDVEFYGVEGQIGVKPLRGLTLLGNFSYNHSELQQDLLYGLDKVTHQPIYEPLKGKQLVETPEWMFGGRAQYEFGPATLGLQTKWVDKRWVTDVNDLSVPSYMTWDMDLKVKLDWITPGTYVQANIINLFDKRYWGSLGTTASADTSKPYSGSPYAYEGAPRTWWTTLKVAF